jgi:hypothetical protein
MAFYTTYSTGTVSVTNGSAAVTGSGTSWSAANSVYPGDTILINNVAYYISTVNSTTSITLTGNYAGTTASGVSYKVTDKTNPPALTAGEAVNINNGVVVTITNVEAWSSAGASALNINNGKLRIENTSTTTGHKLLGSSSAFSVSSSTLLGRFEIAGGWISIGTGVGGTFTLNGSHTNVVTTITVNEDTASAASAGQLYIGTEYISYTGKTQYTFTGCVRGRGGSTAAAYSSSASVAQAASGQTATHWLNDYCPCVWVETAAGSGVYEKYLNFSAGTATAHTITLANSAGAGKYGKFIQQSGTTITFGSGIAGKCPPPGANIRVPNIAVTYSGTFTSGASWSLGGISVDFDTVQLGRIILSGGKDVAIKRTSAIPTGNLGNLGTTVEDSCFTPAVGETATPVSIVNVPGITFTNVSAWSTSGSYILNAATNSAVTLNDCELFQIDTSTLDAGYTLVSDGTSNLTVSGGTYVGGISVAGSGCTISVDGIEYAEHPQLTEANTITTKAVFRQQGTNAWKITNIRVPSGGGAYSFFYASSGGIPGMVMQNITIESSYFYYLINLPTSGPLSFNTFVANVYMAGLRTGGALTGGGNSSNFLDSTFQNIQCGSYRAWLSGVSSAASNFRIRNVASLGDGAAASLNLDNIFVQIAYGATTGYLYFLAVPALVNAAYKTGTFKDSWNLRCHLQQSGDYVTIESPWTILGVTSFQNVAGTELNGSGSTTKEYAIDTGSGYGAWKSPTGANLSAESVSSTTGFRMKLRWTATTTDPSFNYASSYRIAVNTDQTVLYPTDTVDVRVHGMAEGSRWLVERTDTSAVLGQGTAGATGIETISGIAYYGSGSPKYIPWEQVAAISTVGADIWVAQVQDTVAA